MVYLGTPTRNEAHEDREIGYRSAHQQLGLPFDERLIYRCPTTSITPELLQSYLTGGATAFIAENRAHAHALQEAAKQLGKHIPDDLSFAALGDPFDETEVIPDVTGFLTPCREMGREAVRLLIKKLQGDDPSLVYRTTLSCTFIEGRTVANPPTT
jgi:DNA-binding LacI/PurR family transcriptional regulator